MLDKTDPVRSLASGVIASPLEEIPDQPRNTAQVGKIAPGSIKRGTRGAAKVMEKPEYLSVMVEKADKELLEKIAKRRGISVSKVIRRAVQEFLAPIREREKNNG